MWLDSDGDGIGVLTLRVALEVQLSVRVYLLQLMPIYDGKSVTGTCKLLTVAVLYKHNADAAKLLVAHIARLAIFACDATPHLSART